MEQATGTAQDEGGGDAIAATEDFGGTRNVADSQDEQAILVAAEESEQTAKPKKARRPADRKLAATASDWMLDNFRICADLARKCEEAERGAASSTWAYLGTIFDATKHPHWKATSFASFCKNRGIPCTRATLRNPYKALITASRSAGDYPVDTKEASRLGRALVWADRQNVPAGALPDFLRDNAGVSGCVKKLVDANKADKAAKAAQAAPEPNSAINPDLADESDNGGIG